MRATVGPIYIPATVLARMGGMMARNYAFERDQRAKAKAARKAAKREAKRQAKKEAATS